MSIATTTREALASELDQAAREIEWVAGQLRSGDQDYEGLASELDQRRDEVHVASEQIKYELPDEEADEADG